MFSFFKRRTETISVQEIKSHIATTFQLSDSYEIRLFNKNDNSLHNDNHSLPKPEFSKYSTVSNYTVRKMCKKVERSLKQAGWKNATKVELYNLTTNEAVAGQTFVKTLQ